MNTSRRKNRTKLKTFFSLQSVLSTLLAICLYTLLTHYCFSPQLLCVQEQTGSCALLATDLNDPIRPSLKESIDQAKNTIVLIIYSLSDKKIISAIKSAANRGVKVDVICDSSESPDLDFLLGKKVKTYPRHNKGLMHHKLLAIDHRVVWLGSANFTTNSFFQQGNLVVGLNSPAMARQIETLAESFIQSTPFTAPPLHLKLREQNLTFFIHPTHGALSLQALIDRIDRATKRVFVAMFTFTHPLVTDALTRAQKRGVNVRIILDKDTARVTSRRAYLHCKREGMAVGRTYKVWALTLAKPQSSIPVSLLALQTGLRLGFASNNVGCSSSNHSHQSKKNGLNTGGSQSKKTLPSLRQPYVTGNS